MCADFEEYENMSKTVILNFTEDCVLWVASNLSGATGALRAEAIEPRNWLVFFG